MDNVAVIMSVYKKDNSVDFKQAADSVLSQSYKNIELFIFIDGEVGEELNIIIEDLNRNKRVHIFNHVENKGLAFGLNYLIDQVISSKHYKYIARMDSDDICHFDRLELQVNFMNTNTEIDVSGTSCHEFGASFALEEKHLPKEPSELFEFSIAHCPFIHPTVIFRASIFDDGVRYPTDTEMTEDMALWFILMEHGYKFANLNKVLLDYRLNEQTLLRRSGFRKMYSELKTRVRYMFKLKQVTIKNCFLLACRIVFHLLPVWLLKIIYKKCR
jgi:glycosyltransferase involved in cell wall biosynthesis